MSIRSDKLKKITGILFDNDPLVQMVASLSAGVVDLSHEELIEKTKDVFNAVKNPFLKLLHKTHEDSDTFKERTQQALEWYRKKFQDDEGQFIDAMQTYETHKTGVMRFPGQILTFKYDPKYKSTLPYYDQYPLVLTLDVDSQGFLGLNFHYLRPLERALFMGALYKYQSTKEFQPIIKIRYDQLLSADALRYFKPCIKRYLYKHMSPNMAIISPHLWDMALFLPTEKFKSMRMEEGFTKQKVWEKSRKMTRERKTKKRNFFSKFFSKKGRKRK